MVQILQPADLSADFSNDGTNAQGGVTIVRSRLVSADAGNALVIGTDGGLHAPAAGTSATNLAYIAAAGGGTVTSDTGNDATLPLASTVNAGLAPPRSGVATDFLGGDGAYHALPASFKGYRQLGPRHTITASGPYTPTAGTVMIKVQLIGGGGGTPDVTVSGGGAAAGSGGGGGGGCQRTMWAPGAGTITIGAGGAADSDLAGAGGDSIFAIPGQATMRAAGGMGGYVNYGVGGDNRIASRDSYGSGGLTTGGDVNVQPSFGGRAFANGTGGGFWNASSGHGGNSPVGSGGNGESWYTTGGTVTFAGTVGQGYGAGAGGACKIGNGTAAGAVGNGGCCIIEEYEYIP